MDWLLEVSTGVIGSSVTATLRGFGRSTKNETVSIETSNINPIVASFGGRWNPSTGALGNSFGGPQGPHGYLGSTPLSADEIAKLRGWMSWASKNNAAYLPSTHPFKTVAPVIDAA